MAMRRAASSDKPKEEADRHAPAPLSALSALSSGAKPGGRSVAAIYRPANGRRQKYDCCRIRGPTTQAGARARPGAGASAGPRPATGRDAQAGRARGGPRDGG